MTQGMARNGNLIGPASSTDNAIARFDSTTGTVLQNSGVTIDDDNNIIIPAAGDIYRVPWTLWTPTLLSAAGTPPDYTAVALNAGCSYRTVGKICYWKMFVSNVSGGTAGSGTNGLTMTLPVAPANAYTSVAYYIGSIVGMGHAYNGGTYYHVTVCYSASTQTAILFKDSMVQLIANNQNNANREISLTGWYEIA